MRRALCTLLGALCLPLAAGCDAPPAGGPVGAAQVEVTYAQPALPEAVTTTIQRLREISATGSYRDMARMAEETPGFRSNWAGMRHQDYWYLKLRTGDWPMAQVEQGAGVSLRRLRDRRRHASTSGRAWPRWRRNEITPAVARDIDRLLGEGKAAAIKAGEPWPGYVLGIAEDGTWLYFVSGAG